MARKKKKKAAAQKRVAAAGDVGFAVGTRVRVKPGTRDPDYPDMPLGGWAGEVLEIDARSREPVYLVEWDGYTLQHMHPVYRLRCERDGYGLTNTWLGADDLEADAGGPPQMEQPKEIRPRPLDLTIADDRVRAVFQRTTDDVLPPLDDANLRRYYEFLAANIRLPVEARYADLEEAAPPDSDPLTIVELRPPKEGEAEDGLFCQVSRGDQRMELPLSHLTPARSGRTLQLLGDYAYWHWMSSDANGPVAQSVGWEDEKTPAGAWRFVFNAISRCGLFGAALGAAVGAITATMEHVLFAMGLGAVTMAVIGYVAGTRYGFFFGKVHRINSGPILGGILGVAAGAVLGVVAGPLVVAYVGTALGSILGAVIGGILRRVHRRLPGPMLLGIAGALLGAIAWAWWQDPNPALVGVMYGLAAGAAAGLVLSVAFFGVLILIEAK